MLSIIYIAYISYPYYFSDVKVVLELCKLERKLQVELWVSLKLFATIFA